MFGRADVGNGVARHRDDIGPFSWRERSDLGVEAEEPRRIAGTGEEGCAGAHAGIDHQRELHRVAAMAVGANGRVCRSEERRLGKEGVSQGRFRWSPYHYKTQKKL